MDNLRGLLGIRRMDRVQNARIRELCEVKKWEGKRIDEGVENDRIAKSVYVRECGGYAVEEMD